MPHPNGENNMKISLTTKLPSCSELSVEECFWASLLATNALGIGNHFRVLPAN
jgi:hypothetical protein